MPDETLLTLKQKRWCTSFFFFGALFALSFEGEIQRLNRYSSVAFFPVYWDVVRHFLPPPPPPWGEQLAKHKAQHRSITLSHRIDPRPTFHRSDVVALLLFSVTSELHLPSCWRFNSTVGLLFCFFLWFSFLSPSVAGNMTKKNNDNDQHRCR